MIKGIILTILLIVVSAKKFTKYISANQQFCFYDILQTNQKYRYSIIRKPSQQSKFIYSVKYMQSGKWLPIVEKELVNQIKAEINKITTKATTYQFCLKNNGNTNLSFIITYLSGLELMQFKLLPDKSDSQNLEREINWIIGQQDQLREKLDKTRKWFEKELIMIATICLTTIIGINYLLYIKIKSTFKQRKLI